MTISGTSRARLITGQEAAKIMNDIEWNQSNYTKNAYAPEWMKNNLYAYNETSNVPPNGYWTLSARADKVTSAWRIYYTGFISSSPSKYTDYYGIRPVITIPKDKL